jgi:predicted nuclease of predicted toxin-antitoxin system
VRFLADESCDASVVRVLRAHDHDVTSILETAPGATDQAVLGIAPAEGRVLLTEDKDFGELVYSAGARAVGVILIRFPAPARPALCVSILELINERRADLDGRFVVVEPGRVRVSRLPRH